MTSRPAPSAAFVARIADVTSAIQGRALNDALAAWLNQSYPADGEWFAAVTDLCRQGCSEGWLCAREMGGIKFGRALQAADATHGMSVDVVEMHDVVGPHHSHPNGEIDLVMPLEGDARFDGTVAGWKVYGPGSAHHPTVTGGKALVLYLLPEGAIEFTRG